MVADKRSPSLISSGYGFHYGISIIGWSPISRIGRPPISRIGRPPTSAGPGLHSSSAPIYPSPSISLRSSPTFICQYLSVWIPAPCCSPSIPPSSPLLPRRYWTRKYTSAARRVKARGTPRPTLRRIATVFVPPGSWAVEAVGMVGK